MGINKKSLKKILIITSCIYPNKVRTDFPSDIGSLEKRVNRYTNTINKLKIDQFDKSYFIDNSKYEIQNFPNLYNLLKLKNFEIVNFKPTSNSFLRGKGFQECEMINHILSSYDSKTNFFKLTGTIPILNFSNSLKKYEKLIQKNEDFLFSTRISNVNKIIDTRFFYTNKNTWGKFSKSYQNFIDDKNNIYIENALFFFCQINNVKLNLFYPQIGNEVYFDGSGNRYKSSRLRFIIKKFIFKLCF